MGHTYFCTECGQENSAETVLFNMNPLITGENLKHNSLKILKLRLTQQELLDLIDGGKQAEDGFQRVTLSFPSFLGYLSGKNSMNDLRIATLTLDELKDFVYPSGEVSFDSEKKEQDEDLIDFGDDSDDGDEEEVHEASASEWPEAIRAMLEISKTNTDIDIDEEILRNDLGFVARMFLMNDNKMYSFTMKTSSQPDDEGNNVIDGYWIGKELFEEARVCSRCHKPIFRRAGTAEHRVVTFVGETASGKTSTILALTHYCKHGIHASKAEDQDTMIWKNDSNITGDFKANNVFTTVLSDSERLIDELDWFTYGIAPTKTEAGKREDAYHSTIFVTNTGNKSKKMILSLMDLPGELFHEGKVEKQKMYSQFSAAFSSSAFVICFDATDVTQEKITNLTDFYSQLQQLRREFAGKKPWIPCMILFTKCDEKAEKLSVDHSKIEDIYLLRDEKAYLEDETSAIHDTYNSIKKLFADPPFANCYYAVLRTGAFGHKVPSTAEIRTNSGGMFGDVAEEGKIDKVKQYAAEKGIDAEEMKPTPNQIDALMNWILCVSGCMECNAEYHSKTLRKHVTEYMVETQFRAENPETVDQAILRCNIFSNPGRWDEKMVRSLNFNETGLLSRISFLKKGIKNSTEDILTRMQVEPDTNAKGDQ